MLEIHGCSIDTCQMRVSTYEYHVTISRAQAKIKIQVIFYPKYKFLLYICFSLLLVCVF